MPIDAPSYRAAFHQNRAVDRLIIRLPRKQGVWITQDENKFFKIAALASGNLSIMRFMTNLYMYTGYKAAELFTVGESWCPK